jgi:hypothetical protein
MPLQLRDNVFHTNDQRIRVVERGKQKKTGLDLQKKLLFLRLGKDPQNSSIQKSLKNNTTTTAFQNTS